MPELPYGDVLIHAGDLTQGGSPEELQAQLDWLDRQPHTHKIAVAGNHDIALDKEKAAQHGFDRLTRESLRWGSVVYLEDSAATLKLSGVRPLSVFGHPSTRKNGNWAFQHDRDADCFTNRAVDNVDILITHSPPQFHLDGSGAGWGDKFLLRELWRVKPRLHVFGHIHESHGKDRLTYDSFERHYEHARAGIAGLWSLICMALLLVQMSILPGLSRRAKQTILVNAAAVGGLNDAERRRVQVVHL
jgi:Icc-related predicted phosphoesterase